MNSARPHTDGEHHAGDTTQIIRAVVTDHGLVHLPNPIPETPASLSAKLAAVDHRDVVGIQMTSEEATERAQTLAYLHGEPQERYERARAVYLRELYGRPTWRDRIGVMLATLWHKCWGGLVLIVVTTFLTIGLCAQEVPDRIVAAIAEVETGTKWHSVGDVRGTWARGDIGEVSPWQISPAVLRDLKAYDRRSRVHADPILAESLVRLWLSRLYVATGSWSQAVAAYHAGLGGRHRGYARDYADRVLSLAAVL